jgi:hypothetical protein
MNFKAITDFRTSPLAKIGRGNVVKVKTLRNFSDADTPLMVVKKDGGDLYVRVFDGAIPARHSYRDTHDHLNRDVRRTSIRNITHIATSR